MEENGRMRCDGERRKVGGRRGLLWGYLGVTWERQVDG